MKHNCKNCRWFESNDLGDKSGEYRRFAPLPAKLSRPDPNEDGLLAIQSGCPVQEIALAHDIPIWQVYRIARRLDRLNPFDNPSRHLGGRPLRCPDAK